MELSSANVTNELNMDINTGDLVPVLSIQPDWEDFIQVPRKTVWVSCKFRGKSSKHAKIDGNTCECDTGDFSATLGRKSICIRYIPSNSLCRFIPASKVFKAIHNKAVLSLDAAEGGLGISVCRDNKLAVWDNKTGEVRRVLSGHAGDVYKCKLFPSGIVILSGGADMSLKIWSAESGQCPVTLKGHIAAVTDVCIVDRGRNVISVSKDGTGRLWDCGKSSCIAKIVEINETINCCSIGEVPPGIQTIISLNEREVGTENKILLIGTDEGTVFAVVVSTRQIGYTISVNSAVNAIMHFSRELFVAGTQDGQICVYQLNSGKLLKVFHESNSPVVSLARFQEKGVLVGRYDGTVTYYSLVSETSDRLQLTGSDLDPVYDISVTSDSIYTGCRDGLIRRYNVSDLIAGGV